MLSPILLGLWSFAALRQLPDGLTLEVEAASTLDLRDSDVGDAFALVLRGGVSKGRDVKLPKGARVTGHISRLIHQTDVINNHPVAYYIIGLTFESIEAGGRTWAFCPVLEDVRSVNDTFSYPHATPEFEKKAKVYHPDLSEKPDRYEPLTGSRKRFWEVLTPSAAPAAACEAVILSSIDPPEISRGVTLQLKTRSN